MFWRRWAAALTLGALLAIGPGAGLVQAAGAAKRTPSPYASDYTQLEREFRSVGALKFYEGTEELLRTGQFERAFCRYLILKTHIRGQALYTALTAMVDHRLRFLRSQLHLGEGDAYARSYKRYKRRVRRGPQVAKAASPTPDQKGTKTPPPAKDATAADKTKPEGAPATAAVPGEKPPAAAASPAATDDKAETALKGEKESPPEEDEKEKAAKKKPPPPPSYWQRLKRTLQFWK